MNIAIVNTCVPFASGGAEHLAEALRLQFIERGHNALSVRIPFRWEPTEQVLEHLLACRLLTLPRIERVIALRFPAYCVPHPNKVVWLVHQFRQVYDLWGTPYQDFPNTSEANSIRQAIISADNVYLAQARTIFTNSHASSERLRKFNGIASEVLHPPLARSEQFFCSGYGDYFFYPSRMTAGKRQALVVESMKYVKSSVRLVIAGQPEQPSDREQIERIIRENRLESKVEFIPSFISEDEKAQRFAEALGCMYTPYDEDSYGYVTLEAYHSRKPVITCQDSGGVTILVRDRETGLVVEPQPMAVAEAMDELFNSRDRAARMGNAGFELMNALDIHWNHVIEKLLS